MLQQPAEFLLPPAAVDFSEFIREEASGVEHGPGAPVSPDGSLSLSREFATVFLAAFRDYGIRAVVFFTRTQK